MSKRIFIRIDCDDGPIYREIERKEPPRYEEGMPVAAFMKRFADFYAPRSTEPIETHD